MRKVREPSSSSSSSSAPVPGSSNFQVMQAAATASSYYPGCHLLVLLVILEQEQDMVSSKAYLANINLEGLNLTHKARHATISIMGTYDLPPCIIFPSLQFHDTMSGSTLEIQSKLTSKQITNCKSGRACRNFRYILVIIHVPI